MVARLTLNAFTGIGVTGASTGIDAGVALLEGQTGFGGMNISNAGAVTVGGVSDNFLGLWVFGSGDLTLTAGGAIDLADRNGAAAVHGGSQGGNVFLSANGAAADIVRTDGADADHGPGRQCHRHQQAAMSCSARARSIRGRTWRPTAA